MTQQVTSEINIRLILNQAKQLMELVANSEQWKVANESHLCDSNMGNHLQAIIHSLEFCTEKYAQYKDCGGSPNDYFP